jgi:hypothetical protein
MGNFRRNSVRGPGFWTVDAALSRVVSLGANHRVPLRVEALNPFNTFNWDVPDGNLGSSASFGRITPMAGAPPILQFGVRHVYVLIEGDDGSRLHHDRPRCIRLCTASPEALVGNPRPTVRSPRPDRFVVRQAGRHNARHRRAQEFRTIFTSVPERFQVHVRNRLFADDSETCDGFEKPSPPAM